VIRVVRSTAGQATTHGDTIAADLSSMADVNRLADGIVHRHDLLDGVLLNAGIANPALQMTPDGFETTFAVNHLGAFLLAHRLLPLVAKAPQGRIVLTGSSDHMSVTEASVSALASGEAMSYTATYARSKAVAMAAMLEMAHRLKQDEVDEEKDKPNYVLVNVADPGWTRTGLTRNAPLPIRILVSVGRPLQNRTKHSAKVLADLACETMETGTYSGIKGPLTTSALLRNADFRRTAYDDSARLLVERGFARHVDFLPPR
jgi:NAD(P)-dependent dehydrogenase (short-subunit alcohol dehydrogenase family)